VSNRYHVETEGTKPQWQIEAEAHERAMLEIESSKERRYQRMRRQNIKRAKRAEERRIKQEAERIAAIEEAKLEREREIERIRLERIRHRDALLDSAAMIVGSKVNLRLARVHRTKAAVAMQSLARGFLTRLQSRRQYNYYLKMLQQLQHAIVYTNVRTSIVSVGKSFVKQLRRKIKAAATIQCVYRGWQWRIKFRGTALEYQFRQRRLARNVQMLARSLLVRNKFNKMLLEKQMTLAATKIQKNLSWLCST
jgi:hypothetical protein